MWLNTPHFCQSIRRDRHVSDSVEYASGSILMRLMDVDEADRTWSASGKGVPPDAGLRRRGVRLLLIVVIIIEPLGKKGHSDTLGLEGTAADERERDTHQQHQQYPASHMEASPGVAHRSPRR